MELEQVLADKLLHVVGRHEAATAVQKLGVVVAVLPMWKRAGHALVGRRTLIPLKFGV